MRKSKVDQLEAPKGGASRPHRSSSRPTDDTKTRPKVRDNKQLPAKKPEKTAVGPSKGNTVAVSREKQTASSSDKTPRAPTNKVKPSVSGTSTDVKANLKSTSKNVTNNSHTEKTSKASSQRNNTRPASQERVQNSQSLVQKKKSNPPGGDKRLPLKAYKQVDSISNSKETKASSKKTEVISVKPITTASKKIEQEPQVRKNGDDNVTEGKRLGRERTRTRTLNPEESKLMTSLQEAALQLPRDVEKAHEIATEDNGDGYEDDFEDYESDFEEASEPQNESESSSTAEDYSSQAKRKDSFEYDDITTSSSSDVHPSDKQATELKQEERKMDSGHYDLAVDSRKSSGKDTAYFLDIRNAIERENSALSNRRPGLDEPANRAEPSVSDTSFQAVNYVNFAQAKRRHQEKRASNKFKKRGETLLSMIRLDTMGFSLFEMPPVAYEVYMKSYGRSNTQQVFCQTNEDTMSEEVQTDDIDQKNKWTQHPPALIQITGLSTPVKCSVASDPEDDSLRDLMRSALKINAINLEKFLLSAGQVILNLLEEKSNGAQGLVRSNKFDLGFSQGFFTLGTDELPFLSGRRVSMIRFVPGQPNSIVTVHASDGKVALKDDISVQSTGRCMLCVWSLLQPSRPSRVLVSSADVTACCLHISRPHFVFAGLSDGIISVWNLRERPLFENKVPFQGKTWALRPPSYSTIDRIDVNHRSAVVSIQVIDPATNPQSSGADQAPSQICSLDESGMVLVWTVLTVRASPGGHVEDAGIAPGARVRLVLNEAFSISQQASAAMTAPLGTNLLCTDMAVDTHDPTHMYVTVSTGHVVHCLSSGSRGQPSVFLPSWDCVAAATCIAPCPFGLPYFLVGCADGSVRLYTRTSNKPLLTVAGSGGALGSGSEIKSLQWSNRRPFVFFALDNLSRLHVWDLGMSDMYPLLTVPFKGKFINVIQLSHSSHSDKISPFLALGTSCGRVKIHVVKSELTAASTKETAIELDKFKRYVTIL